MVHYARHTIFNHSNLIVVISSSQPFLAPGICGGLWGLVFTTWYRGPGKKERKRERKRERKKEKKKERKREREREREKEREREREKERKKERKKERELEK